MYRVVGQAGKEIGCAAFRLWEQRKAAMALFDADFIALGTRCYLILWLHPRRHRCQCAPTDVLFVLVEDGSGGSHERIGRWPGKNYKNFWPRNIGH